MLSNKPFRQAIALQVPLILLGYVAILNSLPGVNAGTVWPVPTNVSSTGRRLYFHPKHFEFYNDAKESTLLDDAFGRYRDRILENSYPTSLSPEDACEELGDLRASDAIRRVSVYVVSSDQSLGLQASETYTLRVNAPTTIIHATNVFGALRAMESLAQMSEEVDITPTIAEKLHPAVLEAFQTSEGETVLEGALKSVLGEVESLMGGGGQLQRRHHYKRLVLVNETSIWDTPRFRHRGLLIDTARHYLPVGLIKTHLDAMEMAKLNVLHWHIVDDESFPYASKQVPELSEEGAFDPKAVYTGEDITEIVEYAHARGIRVIPEIDTPGHTASWGKSHPEILTECMDSKGNPTGELGPMDPTKEGTFTLIWQVLREMSTRFPDLFVHLGGDEVDVGCWGSNPSVREWMQAKGMGRDLGKLVAYHTQQVLDLAGSAGKEGIVWQEALDAVGGADLPQSTIVHVWKWSRYLQHQQRRDVEQANVILSSHRRMALERPSRDMNSGGVSLAQEEEGNGTPDDYWLSELAKVTATHRAVLSAPWYLNLAPGGDESAWEDYWKVEPLRFRAGIDQKERVIGGEACVWGELVDVTNAVAKTWPLAAAVAERLWADESVQDVDEARERLHHFRCKLIYSGIQAAPLGPGFCHEKVTDVPPEI